MTWPDFYLVCFLVGFSLSLVSFLAGVGHIHLPFKWHLPFDVGHHAGGIHAGHHGGTIHHGQSCAAEISWFNASTIMAFLAWFGGTGYLLTRHAHLLVVVSLGISIVAGLFAAWVVFRFMLKLMQTTDAPLSSDDHRVEGALGTLSMPIRENGTGEIIFSLGGVRRCAGARTDDGSAMGKGTEVVIERYDKGIAYVKKWEEFSQ
jgi:membrane protein implicated in regulation of membrane protease activity